MTAEERRQTLLEETEDVAREDQKVIMEGLEVAESNDIRFSAEDIGSTENKFGNTSLDDVSLNIKDGEITKETLQKLEQHATDIEQGKSVYERFSQKEQRGFIEGGRIHEEASLISGRSVEANENQDERADRQEAEVQEYAEQVGVWHEDTESFIDTKGEPLDSGNESIVVYDENTGIVTKSSNINQYRDLQDALDGITLHNTYFPASNIKVLGFGLDSEGDFQIVTEQPFIKGTHKITQEEITRHFEKLGFEKDNSLGIEGRYKNGDVLLNDMTPKNVILTEGNNIIPIDTIMHLNTPVWEAGGERAG